MKDAINLNYSAQHEIHISFYREKVQPVLAAGTYVIAKNNNQRKFFFLLVVDHRLKEPLPPPTGMDLPQAEISRYTKTKTCNTTFDHCSVRVYLVYKLFLCLTSLFTHV